MKDNKGGANLPMELSENFELLHTFQVFSKSITGLVLHPVSGLCIATSLDNYIKVLNLEALTELFSVPLDYGISNVKVFKMESVNGHACMFAQTDGTIRLWKVTAYCEFFGICASTVSKINTFENMHIMTIDPEDDLDKSMTVSAELSTDSVSLAEKSSVFDVNDEKVGIEADCDSSSKTMAVSSNENGDDFSDVRKRDASDIKKKPTDVSVSVNLEEDSVMTMSIAKKVKSSTKQWRHLTRDQQKLYLEQKKQSKHCVVAYAGLDVRVFTDGGTLLGRLEPDDAVNTMIGFTASVFCGLLIGLFDGGVVRVFDFRQMHCPLLLEYVIPHGDVDGGSCITLIDCPLVGVSSHTGGGKPRGDNAKDMRGQLSPTWANELCVVGTKAGSLYILDLMDSFAMR